MWYNNYMRLTTDIIKIACALVAIAALFIIAQKYLKNQAVTSCLAASSQEVTIGDQKSIYPNKDIYQICMIDKGYETSWK